MSFKRCPGSSSFAQPSIELVPCPSCGGEAEIWSDEPTGTCDACGRTITRTSTQSCLDWCKYARECLGEEKYKQYQNLKSTVRKEALLSAASDRFGWGRQQLNAAVLLMERAEELLRDRPEADPNAVIAAVVLRLGCGKAPAGTSAESSQEVARAVLEGLDYPHGFVEKVCMLLTPTGHDASNDPDAATVREALDGNKTG